MTFKESQDTLLKEGLIKKSPVDYKASVNLIKRAFKDLETAERNLNEDEECSFNYAYNAMLHSGLALMFSEGFRPEIKDKHLTVVRYVTSVLGDEYKTLINNYNFMRKKRHRFIYEPDIPCSKKEAEDALKTAEELIEVIFELIKKKNPQLELEF